MDVDTLKSLRTELDDYLAEFDDCFRSKQSRGHLGVYVRGQLGPLKRKSVEPMALDAGVAPRTLQEFLSLHVWDESAMGRRVREIVARDHPDDDAVGIIDATDFAKKGDRTVGVKRQYCGSSGKIDNCVSTVQLAYATPSFRTLIDSELFLPEDWSDDRARCAAAGIPDHVRHRTKWRIALSLIGRSLADGVPLRWITADEDYGRVSEFRDAVDVMGLLYVVEIPRDVLGWTPHRVKAKKKPARVDELWERGGPPWETYRIKDTTQGPMVWHVRSTPFLPRLVRTGDGMVRLIVIEDVLSGETKYFLSNAPDEVPLPTLLTVAATRWQVERCFQDSKQEIGLGHFEVRKHLPVTRHLAVSLVSLLFLARAVERLRGGKPRTGLVTRAGSYLRRGSTRHHAHASDPR